MFKTCPYCKKFHDQLEGSSPSIYICHNCQIVYDGSGQELQFVPASIFIEIVDVHNKQLDNILDELGKIRNMEVIQICGKLNKTKETGNRSEADHQD